MFPHLTSKWAAEVAKAQTKGKTMSKFEDFLTFQKKVACKVEQLEIERKRTTRDNKNEKTEKAEKIKPPTQTTRAEPKDTTDKEGYTRVERKPRQNTANEGWTRTPAGPPRKLNTPIHDCSLCKEKHWIQACSQFREKNPNERIEYLEKQNLCPRCLRWPHKVETCRFEGKFAVCGSARHHTMIHGATKLELWEKTSTEEGIRNA